MKFENDSYMAKLASLILTVKICELNLMQQSKTQDKRKGGGEHFFCGPNPMGSKLQSASIE